MRAGTILMTWVGMAFLSRTVPELEAVSLPFLFPNREVAYKVMDGPIGDLIDQKLDDKGFIALGFMELGARQVTNSVRPIKTMADLKGLKIRLQPNETHLATFRALGANPLAMDIREVYSAMEQKVIDGHENPYALILDSRFFEVQKYVSNTGALLRLHRGRRQPQEVRGACRPSTRRRSSTAMADAVASQRTAAAKADADRAGRAAEEGHAVRRACRPPSAKRCARRPPASSTTSRSASAPTLVDRVLVEVKKASAEQSMTRDRADAAGGAGARLRPFAALLHGARRRRRLGHRRLHRRDGGWWYRCRCSCATLLNSSIGWADEMSRLTFVWSIFLGIPLGIRAGAHIGMELRDRAPAGAAARRPRAHRWRRSRRR